MKSTICEFDDPITLDGVEVTEVKIRKPGAGELRGLKLTELMRLDTETVAKLVPRVSEPVISEEQFWGLDGTAVLALGTSLLDFFPGVQAALAYSQKK